MSCVSICVFSDFNLFDLLNTINLWIFMRFMFYTWHRYHASYGKPSFDRLLDTKLREYLKQREWYHIWQFLIAMMVSMPDTLSQLQNVCVSKINDSDSQQEIVYAMQRWFDQAGKYQLRNGFLHLFGCIQMIQFLNKYYFHTIDKRSYGWGLI